MVCVYAVVGVFQASVKENSSFDVGESIPTNFISLGGNPDSSWTEEGNPILAVWNALLSFWGMLVSFFVMAFAVFTFNISNPVGIPDWLLWIPWVLVMPVYITVMIGILPVIVEGVKSFLEYTKII